MKRALLVLTVMTATATAWADVPDPEVEACQGKQVGAACRGGACAESTCSRARPGPDGDVESSSWSCMKCVEGAPVKGGDGLRYAIGGLAALAVIGGGLWLAHRKMKARAV